MKRWTQGHSNAIFCVQNSKKSVTQKIEPFMSQGEDRLQKTVPAKPNMKNRGKKSKYKSSNKVTSVDTYIVFMYEQLKRLHDWIIYGPTDRGKNRSKIGKVTKTTYITITETTRTWNQYKIVNSWQMNAKQHSA